MCYYDDSASLEFDDGRKMQEHLLLCLKRLLKCFGVCLQEKKIKCGTMVTFLGVVIRFHDDGAITVHIDEERRTALVDAIKLILDESTLSDAQA